MAAKRIILVGGLFLASSLCWIAPLHAQAPPGPLPATPSQNPAPPAKTQPPRAPVQPRTSILGAWKFNQDDSDDPSKKMQEARGSNGGRRSGGGYPGGGYPGGGYPGGGGYGGRRSRSGESDQERQEMQNLVTPAGSLTIAQKDAEVDVTDDQGLKRALFTDGRKLQKSKDANYQEIAAHWEDKRLVTDEKNPRGGKMSRTFELSYDGIELYETLHMTMGRSNTPVIIRFVYDAIEPTPAATTPASATPAAPPC